jgi:hypothetical protein
MSACGFCGRSLTPEEERRMPWFARIPAAIAMAFVHGGMWAMEGLAQPFCARCRAVLIPIILGAVCLVFGVVAFLAHLWLRLPSEGVNFRR